MDFMVHWKFEGAYLSCFLLFGKYWCKTFLTRNGFEDFEKIVDIWLLKYLMKLLGSKLYIFNTFNLWAFDVGFPLCYDVSDYPVFVMMSLWRVITPSLWRQVKLKALTLHDTGKALSVWVRLGKAKRPHAKEVLHGALSPTTHEGDS